MFFPFLCDDSRAKNDKIQIEVNQMKQALINGKILDDSMDMKVEQGSILIEDGIIKEITSSDVSFSDYQVIDLEGSYILPGLINMHVHLAGNGKPQKKQRDNEKLVSQILSTKLTRALAYKLVCSFAKDELYSGVTTIRTVGGLSNFDTRLRDEIESGKRIGPRMLVSNQGISVPRGHMAGSVAIKASTIDQALNYVDQAKKEKVDLIKLMITGGVMDATEKGAPGQVKMSEEMVKAVCDKAHELGYIVASHVESLEGVKLALRNGVDSIEHGAKLDQEAIDLFKEKKAFLCTTISPALPYALFDQKITHASDVEKYNGRIVFDGIIDCAKQALENDIPVVLGNDVGCPWITQYDFWRELYYFHKYVGVSNAFAIYTVTKNAARIAGIDSITGSIEKGKSADFMVVKKNPLEDLSALRQVEKVFIKGEEIDHPSMKKRAIVERELDRFL